MFNKGRGGIRYWVSGGGERLFDMESSGEGLGLSLVGLPNGLIPHSQLPVAFAKAQVGLRLSRPFFDLI